MVDNGYDIEDYLQVDPIFGSLDDFKKLIDTFKAKNIKVVIDFVPNHTSDQHEWFQKSRQKIHPYTDYYIWKSAEKVPTNWKSVFGGSAWQWDIERKEYFLHQFYKEQPDLNLRNENVRKELRETLRFWLNLGVAGFRVDAVPHFFEDER